MPAQAPIVHRAMINMTHIDKWVITLLTNNTVSMSMMVMPDAMIVQVLIYYSDIE